MALVYRHRRLDTNEVFYIGIELDTEFKKASGNRSKVKHRSKFWKNIVNKTDYSIEIVQNNIDNESAKELEIFLIQQYGRRDLGKGGLVNLTDGGDGAPGEAGGSHSRRRRPDGGSHVGGRVHDYGRIPSRGQGKRR